MTFLDKFTDKVKDFAYRQAIRAKFGFDPEHLQLSWNTWKFGLWNYDDAPYLENEPRNILHNLDRIWNEIREKRGTTIQPIQSEIVIGLPIPKAISFQKRNNILTTSGLVEMAKRGTQETITTTGTTHGGVGTGTNSPALSDIALQTPQGSRKAFDTAGDRATSGTTERYGLPFSRSDFSSDLNITEAGLFTKVTAGHLIARVTASAIALTAGRIMTMQIDITHQNGTEV